MTRGPAEPAGRFVRLAAALRRELERIERVTAEKGTLPTVLLSPGGVRRTVTVTLRPGRETRRVVRFPVDTWR